MGRELRMVPPNWQHPRDERGRLQPMYDENYFDAKAKWDEGLPLWNANKHPIQLEHKEKIESGFRYDHKNLDKPDYYFAPDYDYEDYFGGRPNPEYYRRYLDSEATWFQLYETVSEGTPVTPPFATREELASYLAENGDFWDQERRKDRRHFGIPCEPWGKERAEKFVFGIGSAPSFVVEAGIVKSGVEFVTSEKE